MLGKNYELVVGTPSSDEYCQLRVAAGMSAKSAEAAARDLPNTLFGVMACLFPSRSRLAASPQ